MPERVIIPGYYDNANGYRSRNTSRQVTRVDLTSGIAQYRYDYWHNSDTDRMVTYTQMQGFFVHEGWERVPSIPTG